MQKELNYCRRRLAEESAAAAAASDLKVRAVHLELARRYGERVCILENMNGQSALHLVSAA